MAEIIVAISLFGVAGVLALVLTLTIPTIIENMPGVISAKSKIEANKQRDVAKSAEIERVMDDIRTADNEISRWERELRMFVERRNQFPKDQPLPVLELGQPLLQYKLFEGFVHNNAVIRARRMKEPSPQNPFWEEPRYVLIWAEDLNSARAEIVDKFPALLEWHVEMRGEVKL
jgi:hypothetical protein